MPNSHAVNAKEKFLKDIKKSTPENRQMVKKQNRFNVDMGKF